MERGDADLDHRVDELIERGLALYGGGDLEGAMSAWRHALALDGDNRRAADYVAYVKRHFELTDEQVMEVDNFAPAAVELEIPFGLVQMAPLDESGIEAYESFEVSGTPAKSEPLGDFEEESPTRVRNLVSAEDIDQGWSLETESVSGPNPLSQAGLAPLKAEPSAYNPDDFSGPAEVVTAENGIDPSLAGALASVSAELDDLELPEPAPPAAEPSSAEPSSATFQLDLNDSDPELELALPPPGAGSEPVELEALELDAEPPRELGVASEFPLYEDAPAGAPEAPAFESLADQLEPSGGLDLGPPGVSGKKDKSTITGFPDPPRPGSVELELDNDANVRPTAEITPMQLGDALGDLGVGELEFGPAGKTPAKVRPESLSDVEFDLGSDPTAELQAGDSLADPVISFRQPQARRRLEPSPTGTDLEAQLSELEAELETGSRSVEWLRHDGTPPPEAEGSRPELAPLGGPEIKPLEPRQPRPTPRSEKSEPRTTTASLPAGGVDSARAAIEAVVDQQVGSGQSPDERTRQRIAAFLACAESELGRHELASAALAADMALEESPESALGQKLIHERSDLLVSVFRRYLGDQSGVVAVALPLHELAKHELDHRTAFLLSRVDGTLTIEDILDVSGMARLEAFRCLARLVLHGILEIR